MVVMMMNLRMWMILMSGLNLFPVELEHRFAELKFPNCTNQTQLSTAQSSSSPPCWCPSASPSSPSPSPLPPSPPSSPSCWCPSAPNCCCLSPGSWNWYSQHTCFKCSQRGKMTLPQKEKKQSTWEKEQTVSVSLWHYGANQCKVVLCYKVFFVERSWHSVVNQYQSSGRRSPRNVEEMYLATTK